MKNDESSTEPLDTRLTTADLPPGYELTGVEQVHRAQLNGSEQSQLEEKGIVQYHERAFSYQGEETDANPELIFASLTEYDTEADRNADRETLFNVVREQDGEFNTEKLTASVEVTVATFENDDGQRNTLVYYEDGRMAIYVVTSDSETLYGQLTRELALLLIEKTTQE